MLYVVIPITAGLCEHSYKPVIFQIMVLLSQCKSAIFQYIVIQSTAPAHPLNSVPQCCSCILSSFVEDSLRFKNACPQIINISRIKARKYCVIVRSPICALSPRMSYKQLVLNTHSRAMTFILESILGIPRCLAPVPQNEHLYSTSASCTLQYTICGTTNRLLDSYSEYVT